MRANEFLPQDRNLAIKNAVNLLKRLAIEDKWPVSNKVLGNLSSKLKNAGIRPVDIEAAIANPNKQRQYLITGPSAPGGGGNGALKDLTSMLKNA